MCLSFRHFTHRRPTDVFIFHFLLPCTYDLLGPFLSPPTHTHTCNLLGFFLFGASGAVLTECQHSAWMDGNRRSRPGRLTQTTFCPQREVGHCISLARSQHLSKSSFFFKLQQRGRKCSCNCEYGFGTVRTVRA